MIPHNAGSTVSATVVLDQPGNVSFTNLDIISGRVVVRTAKAIDVSAITVKLEGESFTRLMSPGGGPHEEKQRIHSEEHKILYRVQTVFPPAGVLEESGLAYGRGAFTLPIGQHEYPFSFKIPFNNTCHITESDDAPVSLRAINRELRGQPTRHVKKTLPPTLTGFPGEAEIRYYVKATIGRQSFFKENPRAYAPFKFVPIEPPRHPPSGSEVFARQRHTFKVEGRSDGLSSIEKLMSVRRSVPTMTDKIDRSGQISVDVRLPESRILTCNATVPLRILVKRLNSFRGHLRLSSLQIALIGHTHIRAQDLKRTSSNSWVIVSKSNLDVPIGTSADGANTEVALDDALWRNLALSNTVAPSFVTCNINRSYSLDVRIGISYNLDVNDKGKGLKGNASNPAQSIVLPLRLDVDVYSGIKPPAELLNRMAANKTANPPKTSEKQSDHIPILEAQVATPLVADQSGMHSSSIPPDPIEEGELHGMADPGLYAAPQDYTDAPPSYEDAIASDIGPVQDPRPEYMPPPSVEDATLRRNNKR